MSLSHWEKEKQGGVKEREREKRERKSDSFCGKEVYQTESQPEGIIVIIIRDQRCAREYIHREDREKSLPPRESVRKKHIFLSLLPSSPARSVRESSLSLPLPLLSVTQVISLLLFSLFLAGLLSSV